MMNRFFRIADEVIQMIGPQEDLLSNCLLNSFVVDRDKPDYSFSLETHYCEEDELPLTAPGKWMKREKGKDEHSTERIQNSEKGWMALLDRARNHLDLFAARDYLEDGYQGALGLFCKYRIPIKQGTFLHCAGIQIGGKTLLFPAPSGTGKSTLSRSAIENKGMVLSDDKVFIARSKGSFVAHGTPFGDLSCGPKKSVIDGVFFIDQAEALNIERISAPRAFTRVWPDSYYNDFVIIGSEEKPNLVFKNKFTSTDDRKEIFMQWFDLFSSVPCFKMQFPLDFNDWGSLLDLVN